MSAAIILTGISSDFANPGTYIEVNFAKGRAAGFAGTRSAILIANKTTGGSATPNTKVYGPDTDIPCSSEEDVIALGGAGSEAHIGWLRFTLVNQRTPLYIIFTSESEGSPAGLAVTFANNATSGGFVRLWCGDENVEVAILPTQTPKDIAAAVRDRVQARAAWPIIATSTDAGVLNVQAKQRGPRGNDIKIQVNIFSNNPIGMTVDRGVSTPLAGGTVADSVTSALGAILAKRFYHIIPAAADAAQLQVILGHVDTLALPITGNRQRLFCGHSGTIATSIGLSTALNGARAELVWQKLSDYTPFEIAAHYAAAVALFESGRAPRPLHNFSSFGNSATTQAAWRLKAPRSGAGPSTAEIESALKNGVTPLGSNQNGSSYIVKRITTRSLNGANPDYRIREAHKVTVCDFFADEMKVQIDAACDGKDIADDPPPGAPAPGGEGLNPDAITPRVFKSILFRVIDDFSENGQLQRVDEIKAGTIAQRETNPTSRMSGRVPLQPIDIFDQATVAVDQVA